LFQSETLNTMTYRPLVLSVFPGIGLLDRAFEEEGFCLVRGPDVLWGGDVRRFHPPEAVFEGVIGGPPCQVYSAMGQLNGHSGARHGDLIPEFCRVVGEARPYWWLMENVPGATVPEVAPYLVRHLIVDNRWVGGEQRRRRRFSFGTVDGRALGLEVVALEPLRAVPTVVAGHGAAPSQRDRDFDYSIEDMCEWQGLPREFARELPFTKHSTRRVIGNGVPLPLGRAIARAVKRAICNGSVRPRPLAGRNSV
jgi:DNA (cytosine-5)-methyltransferase 1